MRNESGFEGLQGNPVWTEFQRQHASGRYDLDALWRASDQTGTTLTGDPMTPEVFKKEYDRGEDFYDAFHYINLIDMDVMDVLCKDFERRLRDDPARVLLSMTENEKDDGPKFSSLFGAVARIAGKDKVISDAVEQTDHLNPYKQETAIAKVQRCPSPKDPEWQTKLHKAGYAVALWFRWLVNTSKLSVRELAHQCDLSEEQAAKLDSYAEKATQLMTTMGKSVK